MGATCSAERVKMWRTLSALSMRTRSCAPVDVPMKASLRLEAAHRDPARRASRRALDERCKRGCAVEDDTLPAERLQRHREMQDLRAGGVGGEVHVGGEGWAATPERGADHQLAAHRTGAH